MIAMLELPAGYCQHWEVVKPGVVEHFYNLSTQVLASWTPCGTKCNPVSLWNKTKISRGRLTSGKLSENFTCLYSLNMILNATYSTFKMCIIYLMYIIAVLIFVVQNLGLKRQWIRAYRIHSQKLSSCADLSIGQFTEGNGLRQDQETSS